MTDLHHLPCVRALLADLLTLDHVDEQLPLPVLVNLHRPQLAAPLGGLVRTATGRVDPAMRDWGLDFLNAMSEQAGVLLAERYPGLRAGQIFKEPEVLGELNHAQEVSGGWMISLDEWNSRRRMGEARAQFVYLAGQIWQPLVLLYGSTLPKTSPLAPLSMLEVELGLHRDVRRMLLEMAQVADD